MLIRLLVLLLLLFPFESEASKWDCFSNCMKGGKKYPAECNEKCIEQNNKIQSRQNSYGYGYGTQAGQYSGDARYPDENEQRREKQRCVYECISSGGSTADCDSKCTPQINGNNYDNSNLPAQGQYYPDNTQQWNNTAPQNVPYGGYQQGYGGNMPMSPNAIGTAPVGGGEFNNVDFTCFKSCRMQNTDYQTCKQICAK